MFLQFPKVDRKIPVPETLHISLIHPAWVDMINVEAATRHESAEKGILKI